MGLLSWINEPGIRGSLVARLYSDDPVDAKEALAALGKRGWLTDGSLRGVDLSEANLPESDLTGADFKDVILRQAKLSKANLRGSNLADADCTNADCSDAILEGADLRGAYFVGTDLRGTVVKNALLDEARLGRAMISEQQLMGVARPCGAVLPDGKRYDGRYRLSGDLADADTKGIDSNDSEGMAAYYGVTTGEYEQGQAWADKHVPRSKAQGKRAGEDTEEIESDEVYQWLEPWDVGSYIDLIEWPFKDREGLNDYLQDDAEAKVARSMTGRLSATLLWLPVLIPSFIAFIKFLIVVIRGGAIAPVYQANGLISRYGLAAIYTCVILVMVAIWALIGKSLSQRGGQGGIIRALTLVIVFLLFSAANSLLGGLAVAVSYILGLIITYVYCGRGVRSTLFWLTASVMAGTVHYHLAMLWRTLDISPVNRTSYGTFESFNAIPFLSIPFGYLLAIIIVYALRYVVRDYVLPRVGRYRNNSIAREFMIGYLVAFALVILENVSRYFSQSNLNIFP